jgi:hypothetical protein
MPEMPRSVSAVFTSSTLKCRTIASIFFMPVTPYLLTNTKLTA